MCKNKIAEFGFSTRKLLVPTFPRKGWSAPGERWPGAGSRSPSATGRPGGTHSGQAGGCSGARGASLRAGIPRHLPASTGMALSLSIPGSRRSRLTRGNSGTGRPRSCRHYAEHPTSRVPPAQHATATTCKRNTGTRRPPHQEKVPVQPEVPGDARTTASLRSTLRVLTCRVGTRCHTPGVP